mmetsp:Transcript_51999/g.114061  ORF Transcript_51999/g.114061 Transcript_51999/m.114061 type:complete len:134 (+) Transcript_51999:236-637(+)|eukprot:CAMPEP_0204252152 /NCGR_PEP_ID=MMETSP0468-20130131/935_1 /ASSEMBLY_ACC=CAM_ASM_000383 /TAXON_ID=2969 /ORGANISM="Oxyrrhis marina" /LENGTH=133 /DNA_ID=CAMNT_0051225547 /DNA_START=235 /DNA_END=636 /DNA_ORIENTATION=-
MGLDAGPSYHMSATEVFLNLIVKVLIVKPMSLESLAEAFEATHQQKIDQHLAAVRCSTLGEFVAKNLRHFEIADDATLAVRKQGQEASVSSDASTATPSEIGEEAAPSWRGRRWNADRHQRLADWRTTIGRRF